MEQQTQQTAVEWLEEMLIDNKYLLKDAGHLFEQAKEMEKKQQKGWVSVKDSLPEALEIFSPEEMKEFKWDVTLMDGLEEEPNGEQQSEPKQEPQTDERRELTYGEKLVGISFKPSNNEKVDRIKRLCAELADIVNDYHFDREEGHSRLFISLINGVLQSLNTTNGNGSQKN